MRRNLALSLIFHVAFVCLLLLIRQWYPVSEQTARKDWTWIELDPAQVTPQTPVTKMPPTRNQRVVQTERGQEANQAAPDAFLGERTQTVDRQMISENSSLGKLGSKIRSAEQQKQNSQQSQSAKKNRSAAKMMDLSKLGLPIFPPAESAQPESLDREHPRQFSRSHPSSGGPMGDVAPHEYVKGFRTGEQTFLNTKEYVFYGYFQRIRERLEMHWGPVLRSQLAQMYNSGRGLASDSEHITRLLVTLNAEGEIVRVQMIEESGVKDLDDAAVRAFNQAGPFPNPPSGIIDPDGKIQLRWDFILKT